MASPPLIAAVPDAVILLEKGSAIQAPGSDLANAFLTVYPSQSMQVVCLFLARAIVCPPQGYIHSPTICHHHIAEHLQSVKVPVSIQIVHYIDNIHRASEDGERSNARSFSVSDCWIEIIWMGN